MLKQLIISIPLLASLGGLLALPSAFANEITAPVTIESDKAIHQDALLEQQLDDYLSLQLNDPAAAFLLLDTLVSELTDATPIETKIRALSYYLFHHLHSNNQNQIADALSKLELTKQQPLTPNALADYKAAQLEVLIFRNELNQAFIDADEVIELLPELTDARVIYWVNSLLGRLYRAVQEFEKALTHFNLALDTLDDTDDERLAIRRTFLTRQTATVHIDLKNWQRAQSLLEELVADLKHHEQEALLPEVYLILGFVYSSTKDYAAAENVNLLGLAGARQFSQQRLMLRFMNNLGSDYIEQKKYSQAKAILEQALPEAKAANDEDIMNFIQFNLGYILVMDGKKEAGFAKMQEAFADAQVRNNKAVIEEYVLWFSKAYKAINDYENLAATLEQLMQIRSEIMAAEREQNIRNLQDRYDLKTQNQRITILQQQNALQDELIRNKQLQQTITLLFFVIMAFAGVMLVKLYRKAQRSNQRLKEVNKQLEYQSVRDPLTGLFNRRAMQDKMAKRDQTSNANPCNLLLLDIDFFKHINDNYGHAAGDAVLIEISRRLLTLVNKNELLIRWGGEEFLVVVQRDTQEAVDNLCQKVLHIVSELPITFEGKDIEVTISGGFIALPFAGVPEHQFNWEKVLQVADMALYLSKLNGRNQINLIDGLTAPFSEAEPHLQSDLSGAIREDMISYHVIKG